MLLNSQVTWKCVVQGIESGIVDGSLEWIYLFENHIADMLLNSQVAWKCVPQSIESGIVDGSLEWIFLFENHIADLLLMSQELVSRN